jgi:hypothetical protein
MADGVAHQDRDHHGKNVLDLTGQLKHDHRCGDGVGHTGSKSRRPHNSVAPDTGTPAGGKGSARGVGVKRRERGKAASQSRPVKACVFSKPTQAPGTCSTYPGTIWLGDVHVQAALLSKSRPLSDWLQGIASRPVNGQPLPGSGVSVREQQPGRHAQARAGTLTRPAAHAGT